MTFIGNFLLRGSIPMSHFHIVPEVKKKTEEKRVEPKEQPVVVRRPETPAKKVDVKTRERTTSGVVRRRGC